MHNEKYLTIDVGGTSIKYTITDRNAETININETKTIRQPGKLFESLDEIISPHLNEIEGIAMSFPGKINVETGTVCIIATFPWICDMPLKSMLEEKYNLPVWIENDGKCAALAEFWKGKLSGKCGNQPYRCRNPVHTHHRAQALRGIRVSEDHNHKGIS